jgi:dihydroneopterin aldolase
LKPETKNLMGIIKLTNIRTFSYHGCLEEEAKIGSNYRIDLTVKTNLKPSAQTDELQDTVDYVDLNRIVVEEMAIRAKLLEHVAQRIMNRVLKELLSVLKIKIEVTKLNPPIGGDVEGVTIIMSKKR